MLTHSQSTSVLFTIAEEPDLFSLKPEAIRKAVVDIVVAQLKHRSCTLAKFRAIVSAMGVEHFSALADELKPKAAISLAAKFDKQNSEEAKANAEWARKHFVALGKGIAEPTLPPPKPRKTAAKTPKAKEAPVRLLHESKSMGRRDKD